MTAKIAVITTGGTIASRQVDGALLSVDAPETLLSGAKADHFELEVVEFCNLGSNRIDLPLAVSLAQAIERLLDRADIGGCVVTHGTDTLEESVFIASLVIASSKPVVFTGAQYAADHPEADGPDNLVAALVLAGSEGAWGLGPVVLFDGSIFDPVHVTKVDATQRAAFGAPYGGAIGSVANGTVTLYRRPERHILDAVADVFPEVVLLPVAMGMGGNLIHAAAEYGAKGIVLEGFGCGNATPAIVAAVASANKKGLVTIVTSRCFQGFAQPLYSDGGGYDLASAGAIFAGRLQGKKARILTTLLLGSSAAKVSESDFELF